MLVALRSVVGKELRQTFRDRRMVFLLVFAPFFQLIVLGYAVNLEVEHVPTAIADEDHSPTSRALVEELLAGDSFDRARDVQSGDAALDLVARGDVPVALVVPRGFAQRLDRNRGAALQVLVDGGDSNRAIVAQNAVQAFVFRRALRLAEQRLRTVAAVRGAAVSLPRITVEPRILYNPTLDSQVYFVPGVAATLLLIVTLVVTSMGLAREKESGTLEQVLVSPIRPGVLILGKTIPYAVIGLVDLGLVLGAGGWIFDVPLRGELWIVFAAGLLYLLTTVGMGLLVSSVARTQQQAFMGAFFFIVPAVLLSGFITPVENMPGWLQPFTVLDPVRHFVEVLRAVLLKSASTTELAPQLVALAALGVGVYSTAVRSLRRSLA